MTNAEKWNLIVNNYTTLHHAPEDKVQAEWETYCGELFGYKKLLGEIIAQPHITVGSGGSLIPDIILNINGKDIFDIELKRYSLSFDKSFETQLISYFNQNHISVGMIVCNKIYLYSYEYYSNAIDSIEIPFNKDNPDGIALIEMLSRKSFSAEIIKKYIYEKINHKKIKNEIKNKLTSELLSKAVRNELLMTYDACDIDEVLKEFTFHAVSSTNTDSIEPSHILYEHISKSNHLSKKEIVSNYVLEWCENKKNRGEITPFKSAFHTSRYTRFTTSNMDELIPYQDGAKSGWNNGHFYAYEIDIHYNEIGIRLVLSNRNAPKHIRQIFDKIFVATEKRPRKDNWEWNYVFSQRSYTYNEFTTKEEIFNELDLQFIDLRTKVIKLLNNLQ